MFSTLRMKFGIPGVISVIALVFAMFGGAYAASNSSGGGKATASAKAKKGPKGAKGATGPAGPVGPAGPAGPAGAKGDAGAAGSNGTNGSNGKSVVTATSAPGVGGCTEGGTSVEVAGEPATKKYVCNGEEGPAGQGEPWTAGGTLPVGATQTGFAALPVARIGAVGESVLVGQSITVPISFSIPLAEPLPESKVHYQFSAIDPQEDPGFAAHCTGSIDNPTAPSGELCVYGFMGNVELSEGEEVAWPTTGPGAGTTGAFMRFKVTSDGSPGAFAYGAWAVTG